MAWMVALSALICAAENESTKEQAANLDRADQLISILSGEYVVDPSTQDPHTREEMRNDHWTRITSATLELSKMGDPVVDKIVSTLRKYEYAGSKGDPRVVLMKIGTPKAQKALLDMALGRNGFERSSDAARYYAEMMQEKGDKSACKALLKSDSIGVRSAGLYGISGIALDAGLFEEVRKCLRIESLRRPALSVIKNDPSPNLAEEKVQAMVELLQGVKDLPEASLKKWGFERGNRGNVADSHYSRYVSVLWQITASDAALQKQMASAPEGIVRHCLALALAWRDHIEAVRESLQSFLKDSNCRTMSNLRGQCLQAFLAYGQPEDIAFLRELAAADPYNEEVYKGNYSGFLEKWGDEYINLTKEQKEQPEEYFYPKMEKLAGYQIKPAETIYPIRRAAQAAIKAIEDRAAGVKDAGRGALPPIR
jgi:hypothetical protein